VKKTSIKKQLMARLLLGMGAMIAVIISVFVFLALGAMIVTAFYIFFPSSDYEDPDMTKAFLEHNKEKMKIVYAIENHNKDNRTIDYYKEGFFGRTDFYKPCSSFRISLDRDELVFDIKDIRNLGKEKMFKEAQICLDAAVLEIKTAKEYKEKEEERILQGVKNENKKFDISKVNN